MSKGEEIFGTVYEKGEFVFHQGDLGDTMYIIQSGAVEVSQIQGDKKVVLALLERGDFFGEMALIDKHPRTATVMTIHRTRLLPLTRDSLLERASVDPGVTLHLLKGLSKRIEKTNRLLRAIVDGNESLRSLLENTRDVCAWQPPEITTMTEDKSTFTWEEEYSTSRENEVSPSGKEFLPQAGLFYEDSKECVAYSTGETIFREGDSGNTMYLILKGEVEISQVSGKDKCLLARLCPGEFFGEMAIVNDRQRTATASVTRPTVLLPIHRDKFLDKVRGEPRLALYMLQVLILRLRAMLSFMEAPEKYMSSVLCNIPPALMKKSRIKVAIISLSTCGGCSAVLLDDQEELIKLLDKVDISYCPMLIDERELEEVEVALVDGAVRAKEDEEKLVEARSKSRYLVAWGTCATFGGITALANRYDLDELLEESYGQALDTFAYYLSGAGGLSWAAYENNELKLFRRLGKPDDFVRVDYYLPGCPPKAGILSQLVNEFRGGGQTIKPRPIVCTECKRKTLKTPAESMWVFPHPEWEHDKCFASQGALCMGFVTKGGCGAICTLGGLPCWGCRGPSESILKSMDAGSSFEELLLNLLAVRTGQTEENIKQLLKIARRGGNSCINFKENFVTKRPKIR